MAITLSNGFEMPVIGLGVWRMEKHKIKDLIIKAINIGYRHFDCAANYKSEAQVGEALAEAFESGLVKREELFITSKLWNSDHGHVLEACKDSLKKLRLQYLDLYLVHFPVATKHTGVDSTDSKLTEDEILDIDMTISLETTWHAMEELVSNGLVRSIGISNYDIFLTRDCLAYSKVKPAVNQLEIHPYFQRESVVKFCQKHGICVTAHTPLGGATANTERFGSISCLEDPVLQNTAILKISDRSKMAITLNSSFEMPVVGLGVWRMEKHEVRDLIINAINIGYRHFDCAADYKNEAEVGEALAEAFESGLVKREELFITTKLWNSDHGHVLEACKDSLKKLRLEYLDLYLVHFPVAIKHTGVGNTGSELAEDGMLDIDTTISLETTWHAMEDLVSKGLVRSIGISNYDIFLTRDCLAYSKVKPAVNQLEIHPYFQRESLVKFCQKHGICVTAHTPLGGAAANNEWFGTVSCLEDPVLQGLAKKYGKSAAQIALKWGIQRNTVVIPKTSKLERLKENFQVLDFQIAKEDMDLINGIDRKYRTNQPAKFWGIDLYA